MCFRLPSEAHFLLFNSWRVQDTKDTAAAGLVAFLVAVFSEVLDTFKTRLARKRDSQNTENKVKFLFHRLLVSTLHLLSKLLRYLLMLVAMTYNVALLTAVITGAGFGYLLTDNWKRNGSKQKYSLTSFDQNHEQDLNENNSISNETLPTQTSADQDTFPLISLQQFKDIQESDV